MFILRSFLKDVIPASAGMTTLGYRQLKDDISFAIWPRERVGFLGPNGAGKTTTIRMLLDILKPTAGELTIFGLTYSANKPDILRQ